VGFRPSRIAVAGGEALCVVTGAHGGYTFDRRLNVVCSSPAPESAGGNLAASLVVSILMELDCCEGCGAPGNTGQPSHQPSLAYKAMHGAYAPHARKNKPHTHARLARSVG
jgi:hypothetical protein